MLEVAELGGGGGGEVEGVGRETAVEHSLSHKEVNPGTRGGGGGAGGSSSSSQDTACESVLPGGG